VKVNRPDVAIRTRTGYFGETADVTAVRRGRDGPAETELDRAMDGAAPTGDLPMTLTAAPFGRPGQRTATVAIVAGLDRPAVVTEKDVVRIAARAFDQSSPLRTSKGVATATLQLTPRASGRDTHFDLPTTLELAPGRYEVRVAMESTTAPQRGSAFLSVTVPDFAKDPLALSGVVLAKMPAARPAGRDTLANVLPFTPTTVRTFSRRDRVQAFLRVYQGGKRAAVAVNLAARIVDRENRSVYDRSISLAPTVFATDSRVAESGLTLPLAELASGSYLLSIDASDRQTTVVRHVRFAVD
jgi:hypothetical protein